MTNKDFNNLINKLTIMSRGISQEVAEKSVKKAGIVVQDQARELITSDSGALARSVKIKNEVKRGRIKSTVYTNSEYAPYYEFGTGPNGKANHKNISPKANPKYRQTGWMIPADAMSVEKAKSYGFRVAYKNGDVIGYYTRGQMARPFMYPALHDQENAIVKIAQMEFMKKIKEICKK